jgi:hypothetical protein
MLSRSFEQDSPTELAYWHSRVASLEILVCELLAKNQRMRFVLELPTQERPAASILSQQLGN